MIQLMIADDERIERFVLRKTLDKYLGDICQIYEAENGVKTVYDPSHPDADEEGYVDLPNINLVEEMVGMISASRAYEANATVAENVKTMMQSAMNI